jgi:predicted permease
MRASHVDPGAAMKSGGRGLTAHRGRFSFQRILVVAQVAASLVLLVGALLFVRSFRNLITLDTGFRRDGIVFLEFADLAEAQRPAHRAAAVLAAEAALLAQIRSVPRVEAAAASSQFPLTGASWTQGVRIPGERDEPRRSAKFTYVSDGYFETMNIAMLAGRDVSELDTASGPKVLVVNEIFARRFFPNQNPLGRRVRTVAEPNYPETVYEVVGVVKDTAYASLRDERPPIVYVPLAQHPNLQALKGIVLRVSGPLANVLPEVRRTVSLAYPDMVMNVQPFETQIRDRLVRERVMAWLAGFFGALAAILATIGLYGVIAYIAAQRRQEIGIRLALGASRPQVVTLVLRETALMLLVGLGVGVLLAIAAARGVAAMLFGLSPHDAPTIVACVLLLAASGLAATAVPAIRAAHADPTDALRCD